MIPEPAHSGGQAIQKRNNNLLCYAAVLFVIGLGFLESILTLLPSLGIYFNLDPTFLMVAILFGVLPALGGAYVLWRWWQSGT